MYIVKAVNKVGNEVYKAFSEKQKASAFWSLTITEAEKNPTEGEQTAEVSLYILDISNADQAIKEITEGKQEAKKNYRMTEHVSLAEKATPDLQNPAIGPEILAQAEKAVTSMGNSYLSWIKADLTRLNNRLKLIDQSKTFNSQDTEVISEIVYGIKSFGGSFDYPLVTFLADRLGRFLAPPPTDNLGEREITVVKAYTSAINVVVSKRLKGNGGPLGRKLLDNLERVLNGPSKAKATLPAAKPMPRLAPPNTNTKKKTMAPLPQPAPKPSPAQAKPEPEPTPDPNAMSQEELAKMLGKK